MSDSKNTPEKEVKKEKEIEVKALHVLRSHRGNTPVSKKVKLPESEANSLIKKGLAEKI